MTPFLRTFPAVIQSCAWLAALLLTTGCASRHPEFRHAEEIDPEGVAEFRRLDAQKALLWQDGFTPRYFQFDCGEVEVFRWQLLGPPGQEYVQADFTWRNTTDTVYRHAFVKLHVLDSSGIVHGESLVLLRGAVGSDLHPGTSVTNFVRTYTNGVHRTPGWQWGVSCEAVVERDPTAPPEALVPRRPGAPDYRDLNPAFDPRNGLRDAGRGRYDRNWYNR